MLDAQYANRAFAIDDGNTGEGMEFFFTRFRTVEKIGMRFRLGEVQRFDILGNRSGQTFSHSHPRDVDGFGIETVGGVEFELALPQEIYRTHFARQAVGDDVHDAIELVLGVMATRHDLMQLREDLAGG